MSTPNLQPHVDQAFSLAFATASATAVQARVMMQFAGTLEEGSEMQRDVLLLIEHAQHADRLVQAVCETLGPYAAIGATPPTAQLH